MKTLKEARAEKLLSVRDVAELAGIAFATVHRIEIGKTIASNKVMRVISDVLGVPPEEIEEFARSIEGKAVAA